MADTEVSSLELMDGDMAGTMTTISGMGVEESNVVCRVEESTRDGYSNWRVRVTSRAFYHLRVMGDCGRTPYVPIGRERE
jgi:hypothetical protein